MENKTTTRQPVSGILAFANQATPKSIFLAVFLYIAAVSFLIQLVILPLVFPGWHAGHGLLVSSLDSKRFHSTAITMARQIHETGWQEWKFKPAQAPASIAAAVYAVTVPEPWTLIPINAVLQAVGATIVWLVIFDLFKTRWIATYAIIPFVFFPSAMQWYAQIHKEGLTIAGSLMVLWGWLLILRKQKQLPRLSYFLRSALLIISGTCLAWIARPASVQLIIGASIPVLGLIPISTVTSIIRKENESTRYAVLNFCFGLLLIIAIFPLASTGYTGKFNENKDYPIQIKTNEQKDVHDSIDGQTVRTERVTWTSIPWIPKQIDGIFESISRARYKYIKAAPDARSNIDTNTIFRNAGEVMLYVPRATVIAFLAPFPSMWFDEGDSDPNTAMRRVSAIEMTIVFLALLALIYYIWIRKGNISLWATILFCYFYMLPLALVIVNIGTLYRFRWGALLTIAALGIAGGLELAKRRAPGGPYQENA